MKRSLLLSSFFSLLALTLLASGLLRPVAANAASFRGLQPVGQQKKLNTNAGNLGYHGGPVMVGIVTTYAIFWEPPGFYVSPNYNNLILQYFKDVGKSPIYHNNSQYSNSSGKYPVTSVLGGSWVDTRPYPTTNNELQDADTRNEINLAMKVNGWTPSLHKLFIVFAAKGEIMCSDIYGCTYITDLCAYHYFAGTSTIYAAEPYAGTNLSLCGVPSSPNHDPDADSTINLITHEQFEAATDPFYTAWYGTDQYHDEISDKCVWQFGQLNKYNGDVVWNGHPYEVQEEWDNASSSCVLKGP